MFWSTDNYTMPARKMVSAGAASFPEADWSTWDGSNDGVTGTLFTGMRSHLTGFALSETQAWVAYAILDGCESGIVTLNRAAKSAAISNVTRVSTTGFPQFPQLIRLSSTRALLISSATILCVQLLDISTGTPVVIDDDTLSSPTINANIKGVAHSDSLVTVTYTDISTDDLWLVTISIDGDNITINTPTEARDAITAIQNPKEILAFNATEGVVFEQNLAQYYSLSGTTPSVGSTSRLIAAENDTANNTPIGGVVLDGTRILVGFKDTQIKAAVFTNTSGTLSEGSVVQVSDVTAGVGFALFMDVLRGGYYISAYDVSGANPDHRVIVMSESAGSIAQVDDVIIPSLDSENIDHPSVIAFEGGDYVLYARQNDLTDVYACEYKVITPNA